MLEVKESKLPPIDRQDHVNGALKCFRCVAKLECQALESIKAVVRGECCLVFVLVLDLDSPVPAISA